MALMLRTLAMKVVLHQILKVQKKVWNISLTNNLLSDDLFFSALDILVKAIDKAGYTGKIKIGMDVAASEFFDEQEKRYDLNNKEKGKPNYVRKSWPKYGCCFHLLFYFS